MRVVWVPLRTDWAGLLVLLGIAAAIWAPLVYVLVTS